MNPDLDSLLIEFAEVNKRLEAPSPFRPYVIGAGAAVVLALLCQMLASAAGLTGAGWFLWTFELVAVLLLIGFGIALYVERSRTERRSLQLASILVDRGREAS